MTDATNNSADSSCRQLLTPKARHILLFVMTVLIGTGSTLTLTTLIHSQHVNPVILSSVWPVSTAFVIVITITGTVITVVVIRSLLVPLSIDIRYRIRTGKIIGMAGLIGTTAAVITAAINSTTEVVNISIVSGNESYLAITTAAVLYGIIWFEYYRPRLTHVAIDRVVNMGQEEYGPEFVRDKTAQWDTDTNRSDRDIQYQHDQLQRTQQQNVDLNRGRSHNSEQGDNISNRLDGEIDMSEYEYRWITDDGPGFDAVGGMEALKTELQRDVITPLITHREKAKELGITAPNIIFYGPPGTGKSFIAEALAEELELPFTKLSGADVQSKWINESAQQVQKLFRESERIAEEAGGAVVFLDELDSVLKTRDGAGSTHEEDNKVVNEFLNHLENTAKHNVVFIGATNRLDALDNAGIRAGRIDKKVEIGKPNPDERAAVLKAQLDNLPHNLTRHDIEEFAQEMDGYVPADIERVAEDSAKRILHRDQDAITRRDIAAVINRN